LLLSQQRVDFCYQFEEFFAVLLNCGSPAQFYPSLFIFALHRSVTFRPASVLRVSMIRRLDGPKGYNDDYIATQPSEYRLSAALQLENVPQRGSDIRWLQTFGKNGQQPVRNWDWEFETVGNIRG
jgi:hypothetical protein